MRPQRKWNGNRQSVALLAGRNRTAPPASMGLGGDGGKPQDGVQHIGATDVGERTPKTRVQPQRPSIALMRLKTTAAIFCCAIWCRMLILGVTALLSEPADRSLAQAAPRLPCFTSCGIAGFDATAMLSHMQRHSLFSMPGGASTSVVDLEELIHAAREELRRAQHAEKMAA